MTGILVYHCINKYRSKKSKPEHQTVPDYEPTDKIELRENVSYDPVQKIEMRDNVAYGPVNPQH